MLSPKDELANRLARVEGLLEGLTSAGATFDSAPVVRAMAFVEAYKEAISLVTDVAVVAQPKAVVPLVPYVSAFDPTTAQSSQGAVGQAHVRPYLAAKAARIAGSKK